jgi:putative ABC transport system permease protein
VTFGSLVVKNILRNRRRSFLTMASVAVSLQLLSVFCSTCRYLKSPPTPGSFAMVLMVGPRTSLMNPLPLSYQERISRLPGVASVSPVNMVDTLYGPQDQLQFVLAFDPQKMAVMLPGWVLPQKQREDFLREQAAAVAGHRVAKKFGWKIGDHIPLRSGGYHIHLELVLRGIYASEEDESLMGMHWEYLNELLGRPNKPGGFWVRARTAEAVSTLPKDIDAEFRNSPWETHTEPMKQWVLDFLGMLGNLQLMLLSVSAAVMFSVLLILANTMAMSIRERTSELAVLRALGFGRRHVLRLLAAESLVITLGGAVVGQVLAVLVFRLVAGYRVGGAMPTYVHADLVAFLANLGIAVGLALASTLLPACHASRLSIADALRFVG